MLLCMHPFVTGSQRLVNTAPLRNGKAFIKNVHSLLQNWTNFMSNSNTNLTAGEIAYTYLNLSFFQLLKVSNVYMVTESIRVRNMMSLAVYFAPYKAGKILTSNYRHANFEVPCS